MKTKEKKILTPKGIIFRVAIIAFLAYIVISAIVLNVDIAKRKEKLALAQEQVDTQIILNSELDHLLKSGESPEYIIKIAREKFGFVFPNERVYVDVSGK